MKMRFLVLGSILAFLLYGCLSDAPHENPLDPVHGGSAGISVSGVVEHKYSNTRIEGATVILLPDFIVTRSDAQGVFRFRERIPRGDYTLRCQADGFDPDSVTISLTNQQDFTFSFHLNALPRFESISVASRHEALFFPPDNALLDLNVTASDPDGPNHIIRVWCVLESTGRADTLQLIPSEQRYFSRILPGQLGGNSIQELIGQPFTFFVQDLDSVVTSSAGHLFARFIEKTPITIAPAGQVSTPFTFRWMNADSLNAIPYSFHYAIEIYDNVPIALPPVEQIDNIPPEQTTWFYNNTGLPAGEYYWVLYIIDDFGNRSRSLQTPLSIQ